MSYKIVGQNPANAVLPMMYRHRWPTYEVHYGDVVRVSDPVVLASRNMWTVIWGLYKFKDGAGRQHTVEGRMLLSRNWHDFCGGLLASSAGAFIMTRRASTDWSGSGYFSIFGRTPNTQFDQMPDVVPDLADFVDAPHVTRAVASSIMERSLISAALGLAFMSGKHGILAMDRVDWEPRTRTIMHRATEMPFFLYPQDAYSWCYKEMWDNTAPSVLHDSPERYTNLYSPSDLGVDDNWSYVNANSGRRVGPIMVSFASARNGAIEVPFPESWVTAQTSRDYVRLMPSRLFNNG